MLRRRQRRFFASGVASAQDKGTLALDRLLFERMPRGRCRIADQRRKRRRRRLAGKQLPGQRGRSGGLGERLTHRLQSGVVCRNDLSVRFETS